MKRNVHLKVHKKQNTVNQGGKIMEEDARCHTSDVRCQKGNELALESKIADFKIP